MYKLLTALYLLFVSAVCATPLLFNKDTAKATGVAYFKYYGYAHTNEKYGKLRLAYLVPKLGYTWPTFHTVHNGLPKPVPGVAVLADETLLDLLALTNCKTWYAVVVHAYDKVFGAVYRPYLYERTTTGDYKEVTLEHDTVARGYVPLAKVLHTYYNEEVYKKLVETGVPAHPLTLYLRKYYY